MSTISALLLTMATARRISEVQALGIVQQVRFIAVDGSLTVRTQVVFLIKNQLTSRAHDSIRFLIFLTVA